MSEEKNKVEHIYDTVFLNCAGPKAQKIIDEDSVYYDIEDCALMLTDDYLYVTSPDVLDGRVLRLDLKTFFATQSVDPEELDFGNIHFTGVPGFEDESVPLYDMLCYSSYRLGYSSKIENVFGSDKQEYFQDKVDRYWTPHKINDDKDERR